MLLKGTNSPQILDYKAIKLLLLSVLISAHSSGPILSVSVDTHFLITPLSLKFTEVYPFLHMIPLT